MVSNSYVKRMLVVLALVGALALLTGVLLGIGAGRSLAGAVPAALPEGTLGVGDRLVPPLGTSPSAGGVVVIASRASAASLIDTAPLVPAPVVRPVARRAPAPRATTTRAARSTASQGGWNTARASWYGPGFYGRKTASGAVYTQTMMNVAHRSLPFGTRIQFEYNGRSCIAVVNDRGPFVAGRTFDLGAGTAKALGFGGVHVVKYRILGR